MLNLLSNCVPVEGNVLFHVIAEIYQKSGQVKSYRTSLNEWHPGADPEDVPLYAIASIAKEIEDGNNITFDRL